jgi:membrane protein DedA with SNARE-associated domain/rhodanese-related sulfurtransferase
MNETVQFLARHGYLLLIVAILGRQACLPIPANLVLVAAGALARSGRLSLSGSVCLSVATFMIADLIWYEAGRRFGERILHFVCGLSRDSSSYAHRATSAFSKHGVRTLSVSKFVFGLDAVAAPLAGMARTPAIQFLLFDALGAAFWAATYASLGYAFSDQLDRVAEHVVRMGTFLSLAVAAGVVFYIIRRFARWYRFVRQFKLARITPEQLRDKLNAGEDVLLIDLQGRPHAATERMAIPGAVCINPRALEQSRDVKILPSREVILYCASPGEFTSARVALALRDRGIEHVRPLAGGLKAWRDRGFPVTSDVRIPESADVRG